MIGLHGISLIKFVTLKRGNEKMLSAGQVFIGANRVDSLTIIKLHRLFPRYRCVHLWSAVMRISEDPFIANVLYTSVADLKPLMWHYLRKVVVSIKPKLIASFIYICRCAYIFSQLTFKNYEFTALYFSRKCS